MNNAFKIPTRAARSAPDMGIDWEFQPSLQHLVVRTDDAPQDTPTWAETMPAAFDSFQEEPVSFREPLEGLAVRDLNEPEIFLAFFGGAPAANSPRA